MLIFMISRIRVLKSGLFVGIICLGAAAAQAQPKHELNKTQYRILSKEEMSAKSTAVAVNQNQFENVGNYKTSPKPKPSANLPSENLPVDYITTGVGAKNNYKSQFVPKE